MNNKKQVPFTAASRAKIEKYGLDRVQWHNQLDDGQYGAFFRSIKALIRFWNRNKLECPPQWIKIDLPDDQYILTRNIGHSNISIACKKNKKGLSQALAYSTWNMEHPEKTTESAYTIRVHNRNLMRALHESREQLRNATAQQREILQDELQQVFPQPQANLQRINKSLLRHMHVTGWPNSYTTTLEYYAHRHRKAGNQWSEYDRAWMKIHAQAMYTRISTIADDVWIKEVKKLSLEQQLRLLESLNSILSSNNYNETWRTTSFWMLLHHIKTLDPAYRSHDCTYGDGYTIIETSYLTTFSRILLKDNSDSEKKPVRWHMCWNNNNVVYAYGVIEQGYGYTLKHMSKYYQHRMIHGLSDNHPASEEFGKNIKTFLQDNVIHPTNTKRTPLLEYSEYNSLSHSRDRAAQQWFFHMSHLEDPIWLNSLKTVYTMFQVMGDSFATANWETYLELTKTEDYRFVQQYWDNAFELYSIQRNNSASPLSMESFEL